jgi:hypothetical protein
LNEWKKNKMKTKWKQNENKCFIFYIKVFKKGEKTNEKTMKKI